MAQDRSLLAAVRGDNDVEAGAGAELDGAVGEEVAELDARDGAGLEGGVVLGGGHGE